MGFISVLQFLFDPGNDLLLKKTSLALVHPRQFVGSRAGRQAPDGYLDDGARLAVMNDAPLARQ
jgi:hypothetical protein